MNADASAVLFIVAFYLLLEALGITCPIKYLTGISCPGCGMSRALLSVLRLDFASAFHYHALWPLLFVLLPYYLYCRNKKIRMSRTVLGISVVLFLAYYFYRILYGDDTIAVFEPESGIIVSLIHRLKNK